VVVLVVYVQLAGYVIALENWKRTGLASFSAVVPPSFIQKDDALVVLLYATDAVAV
jgi:hypothetical protein